MHIHTVTSFTMVLPDGNSLYLKAMAYGIDEVLDAFRQKLVALEEKVHVHSIHLIRMHHWESWGKFQKLSYLLYYTVPISTLRTILNCEVHVEFIACVMFESACLSTDQ